MENNMDGCLPAIGCFTGIKNGVNRLVKTITRKEEPVIELDPMSKAQLVEAAVDTVREESLALGYKGKRMCEVVGSAVSAKAANVLEKVGDEEDPSPIRRQVAQMSKKLERRSKKLNKDARRSNLKVAKHNVLAVTARMERGIRTACVVGDVTEKNVPRSFSGGLEVRSKTAALKGQLGKVSRCVKKHLGGKSSVIDRENTVDATEKAQLQQTHVRNGPRSKSQKRRLLGAKKKVSELKGWLQQKTQSSRNYSKIKQSIPSISYNSQVVNSFTSSVMDGISAPISGVIDRGSSNPIVEQQALKAFVSRQAGSDVTKLAMSSRIVIREGITSIRETFSSNQEG